MATTRAATFSAKIRTLSEFQIRLQTNQQSPSSAEIITTLRYFQQTLVGFLRDLPPPQTHAFCRHFSSDQTRWNLCPNLNYSGLFYAIVNLLDVFPLIQSNQLAIAEAIIDTLKAVSLFLDRDALEQLPLTLAAQLGVLPAELDKKIVHVIADCILPFAISADSLVRYSIPGIFMLVFQHSPDPSLHTYILEAAMACTDGVYADVISVLARGTSASRVTAANLLLHYWPFTHPRVLHRKIIQYKVHSWSHVPCQNTSCPEKGPSVKKCYDPLVCADSGDASPPLFLCRSCADDITSEKRTPMENITQPMAGGPATCQNKNCNSNSRVAIGTCFSIECIRGHGFSPLRLCQMCYDSEHEGEAANHVRHIGTGVVWGQPLEWTMIEAVVKLLRETAAHLEGHEGEGKRPKWLRQLESNQTTDKDKMSDERRMLSRYGIWLMSALCPPSPEANPKALHYMMTAVFQWFSTTALLPSDSMGASLEQLKSDFVCDWIQLAIKNHYDVFIDVLSPEAFYVNGALSMENIKEGLGRLLSLTPYDIVSLETWGLVMPKWLQAISDHSEEEHLSELKVILCKIFEPDLCPLPFGTSKLFEFIMTQLNSGKYEEMSGSLRWIHQLSRMEIKIPLAMLLDEFTQSFARLSSLEMPSKEEEKDLEEDDVCIHVVIIDILVMQMRLNEIARHEISTISEVLFSALSLLIGTPMQVGSHCCHSPDMDEFADCNTCQQSAFFYQMLMNLTETVSPKEQMKIVVVEAEEEPADDGSQTASHPSSALSPLPAPSPVNQGPFAFKTAKVIEQGLEFVGILPSEEIETAMASAVTVTESDAGRETCHAVTSTLIQGTKGSPNQPQARPLEENFWETSVGRFKFSFDQLPPQLRLIHALLSNIDKECDPDVQFFILRTLKLLCLHCESLSNARREHRGFLVWAQEQMLVPKLWSLLRSDYIQVGEMATLLLIHCITFPSGEDMLWKVVPRDFTSEDWKIRFDAVGHAYVFMHLVQPSTVRANTVVQLAMSQVAYHLIVSVHDPHPAVAQRALCALKALPSHTLRLITMCLEAQFDTCILDRPLAINALQILITQVPDEMTLTFDFFIQRFETLVLESQLSSQNEESLFVQDLMHSDPMSDLYQRKVARARRALEDSETARSIAKSLANRAFRHQMFYISGEPPKLLHRAMARRRGRHRLSAAALSCRRKILKVVTLVRVVNRWRDVAASITLNAASIVQLLARSSPIPPPIESSTFSPIISPSSYSAGAFGRLREFTDQDSNMCQLFNRVFDMSNKERHTVYLTVSLFVSFLCNNKANPQDEKANAKKQSVLFRHFNTLLGYSNTEKCFTIPPARLRKAAVCNAFLTGLPDILDSNLVIANQLLPLIVQLLVHLPSPQKLASDQHSSAYSLGLLHQHARHLWLQSLILILYKYRFDQPIISEYILKLINIVSKTLQNQSHVCSDEDNHEIAGWSPPSDDSGEEDDEQRVRPESLTVTTIEEGHATERVKIVAPRRRPLPASQPPGDEPKLFRCRRCNEAMEVFDEETISLSLVAMSTFLQRDPVMAAPLLFNILHTITRLVDHPLYPWHDSDIFVPGNSRSVAKQLLRVVLHQLSGSGICLQLFDSRVPQGDPFWSVLSFSLADFADLNPVSVIQLLLEDIAENWPNRCSVILTNLSQYVLDVAPDAYLNQWSIVVGHLEAFFRRYHTEIIGEGASKVTAKEVEHAISLVSSVMRVQNFSSYKNAVPLAESFGKWLVEMLHHVPVKLESLLTVCTACNRSLIRERDKQTLSRSIIGELMQAIRFKCTLHVDNYVTIATLILQDGGEDVNESFADDQFNTAASEAVRPHLFEILDFIADLHVLAKLKKETSSDTVGGDIKVWLACVVAVEMSRSSTRDCRTVIRFIPWLMSPPSVTQSPPGAFADSVTNVRVLSWLLLGALSANQGCLPVPIECSHHMADYIHFVLAGFADQSKQSVVHMSALFHAFHLCQLWTVYCERASLFSAPTAFSLLLDFWARVTPAILQLLSHSKVLADMVNLHFLNTMQALQQVNSALLCQLYAMWSPILTAYHSSIPNQLRIKLDACENQPSLSPPPLSEWINRVRFKISQVELQTSAASPFYNV